ncbi:hypothetical protein BC351_35530 [Paenibacillus ferrarius]|uniref:Uncharacterized protein n=1 Tax=Paenibacillus ferrarius TaxID=1469647 RepID=A0A1V4HE91_9BACL|nr:hypothetical protein [Paenibacillus ferrarius]OPH51164.1 hypothetical protein BC351_35530 [Paenibacillus ferrarius]
MSIRTTIQDLESIAHCFEDMKNIVVARLVPEDVRAHFRQVEKEALSGFRSLLDAAIIRLEEDNSEKRGNDRYNLKQIPVED